MDSVINQEPEVEITPTTRAAAVSHQEAMELVQEALTSLVQSDPLLGGGEGGGGGAAIPTPVTLEEVHSLIALEHGQAMTVHVRRADGETLPVIVEQGATVLDLKKALKRHFALRLSRSKDVVHLSWRYIWRTHGLAFEGQRLDEEHRKLRDHYGIRNRDVVTFTKKLKAKNGGNVGGDHHYRPQNQRINMNPY